MNRSGALSDSLLPQIESRLASFLAEKAHQGIVFNSLMTRYHLSTGGKRLRALIPSSVYTVCGADAESAIPLGCALELIHNATLVHDDLQDGDQIRRGQAAVWKKWSPAQAINCGDALFQFATELVCDMKTDGEALARVIRRLAQGTLRVIEGQAQEFLMKEERFPSVERYLEVAEAKTAALVATAVVCAMESLGANERALASAEDAALQAGVLFQLQDDLLDLYGEKQRDQPGNDIAEGKISVLIALFNEKASQDDRERMAAILRAPREQTSEEEIENAMRLLGKYRIKEAALGQVAGIQARLENHELRVHAPPVHRLILELSARFLDPIRMIL